MVATAEETSKTAKIAKPKAVVTDGSGLEAGVKVEVTGGKFMGQRGKIVRLTGAAATPTGGGYGVVTLAGKDEWVEKRFLRPQEAKAPRGSRKPKGHSVQQAHDAGEHSRNDPAYCHECQADPLQGPDPLVEDAVVSAAERVIAGETTVAQEVHDILS
jgi:hypothetical protein